MLAKIEGKKEIRAAGVEMVRQHHGLNGHESEKSLGEDWCATVHGHRELDTTSQLYNGKTTVKNFKVDFIFQMNFKKVLVVRI